MRDSFGREIHYLRISLTDRCNLRCIYCMPEQGQTFLAQAPRMTDDELVRIVSLTARLGFNRIRLTGGEPTVRPNLTLLIERINQISGIREIAMTTNGMQLEKMAEPLARAGLKRVNVSLDSLDSEQFALMTRFGKLDAVWRGILAAENAGMQPIKLNAVVVRGYNENAIADLARLTLDHPWQMRFIEVMPLGSIADFQMDSLVPVAEMKERIESALGPLEPLEWSGHTPHRPYRLAGAVGTLGFISSVSDPFCAGCNRIRMTADGHIRLCLLRDDEVDVLSPLRRGADDEELLELMQASIFKKPWGHGLSEKSWPQTSDMSEIGG
ncbi:MAG: GTP 3',8-cyclase MoaA [Chloroflexi bacterium]|nr:GTP 3',8-cyclase MoaA [Chloroflexota bacterium]MCL5950545.1 GTP 3',8-cyclase MoaA [Chloroflexota bacterium]